EIFKELNRIGEFPPVLDARLLLLNPAGVLQELCKRIGIDFQERMLHWEPGPRPEDGPWAKYWYENLHQSTGFRPYQPKTEPFPPALLPLLKQCRPYYDMLKKWAIEG
ncbi:MAG: hypothetical protein D6814_06170, partial [Calditrichaeota bacterium]